MKIDIIHSKDTLKFIEKHSNLIDRSLLDDLVIKAVRKITKIENNNVDIKKIKGSNNNYFRIRTGDIRIIFKVDFGIIIIAFVEKVGFRGSIY